MLNVTLSLCHCVPMSPCCPPIPAPRPVPLSGGFQQWSWPHPCSQVPIPILVPSPSLSPHAMAVVSPVSPCVPVVSLTSSHIPEVSLVSPCVSLGHIHGVTHTSPCTPMCPHGVTDVPTCPHYMCPKGYDPHPHVSLWRHPDLSPCPLVCVSPAPTRSRSGAVAG